MLRVLDFFINAAAFSVLYAYTDARWMLLLVFALVLWNYTYGVIEGVRA